MEKVFDVPDGLPDRLDLAGASLEEGAPKHVAHRQIFNHLYCLGDSSASLIEVNSRGKVAVSRLTAKGVILPGQVGFLATSRFLRLHSSYHQLAGIARLDAGLATSESDGELSAILPLELESHLRQVWSFLLDIAEHTQAEHGPDALKRADELTAEIDGLLTQ